MPTDQEIGERLATARRAAGYSSAAAAARALGIPYPTYAGHENGSRGLRKNIADYARKFGVSADWLLTGAGPRPEASAVPIPAGGRLPYGGVVAAGDWLTVDEFNQDLADQVVPESVPRHPGYPKLEQIAWRVRGDSMDQAGILDGMWLVGAPYLEYVDRIGELDNGAYVVVERTRYQGAERELTVKEVQFARRGMRLIPRSSNPRHREFFIDLDEKADPDTESVRILGVVLWAGRDLAPGR
jgi:SOS-response transcriptional repressor LexA